MKDSNMSRLACRCCLQLRHSLKLVLRSNHAANHHQKAFPHLLDFD